MNHPPVKMVARKSRNGLVQVRIWFRCLNVNSGHAPNNIKTINEITRILVEMKRLNNFPNLPRFFNFKQASSISTVIKFDFWLFWASRFLMLLLWLFWWRCYICTNRYFKQVKLSMVVLMLTLIHARTSDKTFLFLFHIQFHLPHGN